MKEYEKTQRGFIIFGRVKDTKDCEVRIQESSSAEEYACWIFCTSDDPNYQHPNPHLNVEQAKEVIKLLQEFINFAGEEDDGSL